MKILKKTERIALRPEKPYIRKKYREAMLSPKHQGILEKYKTEHNIRPRSLFEKTVKRAFDVAGASVALLVAAPIIFIEALTIKLSSEGPVLYKQMRLGKDGKPFEMYKFRSMGVLHHGHWSTNKADERIIPAMKIYRKLSLDELPQLFNILKGDYSFVGPRAVTKENMANLINQDPESVVKLVFQQGMLAYDVPQAGGSLKALKTEREYSKNHGLRADIMHLLGIGKKIVKGDNY